MSAVRFAPKARQQLAAIWEYSVQRWGERRADRYLLAINDTIALVVAGKRRARPCEQYGRGLHSIRSGSHNIYLRHDADHDTYWIVGVLHQRMEQSRQLLRDHG